MFIPKSSWERCVKTFAIFLDVLQVSLIRLLSTYCGEFLDIRFGDGDRFAGVLYFLHVSVC